jgi:hypothetical protein
MFIMMTTRDYGKETSSRHSRVYPNVKYLQMCSPFAKEITMGLTTSNFIRMICIVFVAQLLIDLYSFIELNNKDQYWIFEFGCASYFWD